MRTRYGTILLADDLILCDDDNREGLEKRLGIWRGKNGERRTQNKKKKPEYLPAAGGQEHIYMQKYDSKEENTLVICSQFNYLERLSNRREDVARKLSCGMEQVERADRSAL